MPPNTQYTNDRLDKIDTKLDKVLANQNSMELKLTRRVDRNTLILNTILWVSGVLFIAGVSTLLAFL